MLLTDEYKQAWLKKYRRRLNVLCMLQRQPPLPRRYATVEIRPLNGGAGAVYINFATRGDFLSFWNGMNFPFKPPTDKERCGAIGNSILNIAWKMPTKLTPADYGECEQRYYRRTNAAA